MYQHSKNDNDNSKMATKKKRFIKYKAISGKLQEHIGFKLLAGGNIKDADKVYCIHCDKSLHTMDLIRRLLITFKKNSRCNIQNLLQYLIEIKY